MPATTPTTDAETAPLEIDVAVADARWRDGLEDAEGLAALALNAAWSYAYMNDPPAEVSVRLTDDAEVRDLNCTYRGIDKPTNVLSFGGDEDTTTPDGLLMLGDIVLAFETVAGEAAAGGIALRDHFCHLMVHGMLHLLGYDHEDDDDAEEMEGHEIAILATLGIADPYAESGGS